MMGEQPKPLPESVANDGVATHNRTKRRLEKPSVLTTRTRVGVGVNASMEAYTPTAVNLSASSIDDRPAAAPRGGGRDES